MKEIEVKARVRNKAQLLKALKEAGIELSTPKTQADTIYALHAETDKFMPGAVFVRIRIENPPSQELRRTGQTVTFNLKKSLTNELDSLEHETEVKDAKELAAILELIGFKVSARVNKVRRKAQYEGYELCVDEVEGLGSFIEIEKLTNEANSAAVQAELFAVLERFGVTRDDQVVNGYDTLMLLNQQGKLPWQS